FRTKLKLAGSSDSVASSFTIAWLACSSLRKRWQGGQDFRCHWTFLAREGSRSPSTYSAIDSSKELQFMTASSAVVQEPASSSCGRCALGSGLSLPTSPKCRPLLEWKVLQCHATPRRPALSQEAA